MQDRKYTNMWGEDLEEQKKRREWLRQVYDNAINQETGQQTSLPQENQTQTPYSQKSKVQVEDSRFFNKVYNEMRNTYNQAIDSANSDIWKDSFRDLYADAKGIVLGAKNPDKNCDDLVSRIYPRYIRR